jgi:hypothetical protein
MNFGLYAVQPAASEYGSLNLLFACNNGLSQLYRNVNGRFKNRIGMNLINFEILHTSA